MTSVCSDQKLREFLLAQSPAWLTERLLDAAAGDPVLLAGLQVAASGSDGAQIVRRELDRAIRVDEYVEWDESATYVYHVNRALELLADLIRDGAPDQAIELAEHAMDLLEQAVERVHDDGDTHGCLAWAQQIHVRACAAGSPDPTALAQRLFTRATADEWGVFTNVVADYADVLGPAGLPRCVASSPRSCSSYPGWVPGRALTCTIPRFWSWPSGQPRPTASTRWSMCSPGI